MRYIRQIHNSHWYKFGAYYLFYINNSNTTNSVLFINSNLISYKSAFSLIFLFKDVLIMNLRFLLWLLFSLLLELLWACFYNVLPVYVDIVFPFPFFHSFQFCFLIETFNICRCLQFLECSTLRNHVNNMQRNKFSNYVINTLI